MNLFNQKLLDTIGHTLISENMTVAIAEEVTTEYLQLAFSQMENSLLFYKGGITVVNIEEAAAELGFTRESKGRNAEFIGEIAKIAALKVSDIFVSNWAIGTAGFAVPKRGSCYKLFVEYAFAYEQ